MKLVIIAAAMAATLLGGAASPARALRSEAGDRGVRLENDALRTDVRRERLKIPQAKPNAATKLKRRPKTE
jgi:outer membrane murein-binding lipoprotein Lpp